VRAAQSPGEGDTMKRHKILLATLLLGGVLALSPRPASAQQPYYLYDRGDGIPTSLLGTYVRKGELLAYSFYEYTRDSTNEYKPSEMGFKGPRAGEDFFGKLEQHEFLLFFAYGFTDWLAGDFEFGEYAIEYIKRLSPNWLVVLAFEGEQDEQSIIGEVQYSLSKNIALKVNCGFGVTKKAPDFAPEIGLLFRF